MTDEYFFDTYAIIEIFLNNVNYSEYLTKNVVLTKLNLFEIFYSVLNDFDDAKANEVFDIYSGCVIDYDNNVIKKAAKFRSKHKKRNLSMVDCIGYILADELGIKFLTGDKEFEDMPNVEFVK